MQTRPARLAASLLGMAGLFASAAASAAVIYNEATTGDLSNLAATPTALGLLAVGTSTVTGRLPVLVPEHGIDDPLDFLSFVVASGTQVSAIRLTFNQTGYPDGAGISLFAGANGSPGAALLGSLNTRSSGIASGADLLATPAFLASGPLLPGAYTFNLDGTGARLGLGSYGVNITVVGVPEPASGLLAACSLLALVATGGRRAARKA